MEEQTILKAIKDNSFIKQEEIAQIIGKSPRTIKTIMNKMQKDGIIIRINGKRNGKWIIK